MAFVEDNASISSIPYFENHVRRFVQDPINLNFCLANKCFDNTQTYT